MIDMSENLMHNIQTSTMQDFVNDMNYNFALLLELYSKKIADTESFNDNVITNAKIQNNAVVSEKISPNSIMNAHIGNGQITTQKIANDTMTVTKISTENGLQRRILNMKPVYVTTNLNQTYPAYSVILYYE